MKNYVLILALCIICFSCKEKFQTTVDAAKTYPKVNYLTAKASATNLNMMVEDTLNMEYSSNIVINDNKRWQLAAASQNYGGNYAVFGKFHAQKTADGNSILIDSIHFRLLNYKNIIPIGIEEVFYKLNESVLEIKILVKAFGEYQGFEDQYKLNDMNLKVSMRMRSNIHTERILLPMYKTDKQGYDSADENEKIKFDIELWNQDGSAQTKTIYGFAYEEGKSFDTEFFYKDGEFIASRQLLGNIRKAPGKRCRDAFFSMLYVEQ